MILATERAPTNAERRAEWTLRYLLAGYPMLSGDLRRQPQPKPSRKEIKA